MVCFVATKPLQIITSILVARQLRPLRSRLVVVPNFADGDRVVERLSRHETGFESIKSAPNRFAAILSARTEDVEQIFVDSDVGVKTLVAMQLLRVLKRRVRFSLYEEGIALIEPDQSTRPPAVFKRMGVAMDLGDSRVIEEIWTYTPDAVRDRLPTKAVRRIAATVGHFVRAEHQLLQDVFWETFEKDTRGWGGALCHLYLSSWRVDRNALAYLARSHGYRIFKPHPHIRHDVALTSGLDQVLPASIPAELVIVELARAFTTVEVVHHGSSVASYVSAPNVRYVRAEDVLATATPSTLEHA